MVLRCGSRGLAGQKERGALFLPRAIAVLGERLGGNANEENLCTGLTERSERLPLRSTSGSASARGTCITFSCGG